MLTIIALLVALLVPAQHVSSFDITGGGPTGSAVVTPQDVTGGGPSGK